MFDGPGERDCATVQYSEPSVTGLDEVDRLLTMVLEEVRRQDSFAAYYPNDRLSFIDQVAQIAEWIDVGEEGLAFEVLEANLAEVPFHLSDEARQAMATLKVWFENRADAPRS